MKKIMIAVLLSVISGCAYGNVSDQEETASTQEASSVKAPSELNAAEVELQPELACSAMFESCTAIPCCGGMVCTDTTGGSPDPVYVCVMK